MKIKFIIWSDSFDENYTIKFGVKDVGWGRF